MLPYGNRSITQKGMVLIIVLIFLQLFALIGLHRLQSSLLAEKMSRDHWKKHRSLVVAEHLLREIEIGLKSHTPKCLIAVTGSENLLAKPLDWWQSTVACAGKFDFFQYYYVVEPLGRAPCVSVNDENFHQKPAEYFRLTLLIITNKNDTKEMLQSTIVKLDNALCDCNIKGHRVVLGRQVWRTL